MSEAQKSSDSAASSKQQNRTKVKNSSKSSPGARPRSSLAGSCLNLSIAAAVTTPAVHGRGLHDAGSTATYVASSGARQFRRRKQSSRTLTNTTLWRRSETSSRTGEQICVEANKRKSNYYLLFPNAGPRARV